MMGAVADGYCGIYARCEHPRAEALLAPLLADPGYEVDVQRSDDLDRNYGDDFVLWPTRIDVEPTPAAGDYVGFVRGLLETLWDAGIAAVAACDFEDELPEAGGIRRWPPPAT